MLEEGEVERLKAVEAVRSKFEDTLLLQVQELQRQVAELQSHTRSHGTVDLDKTPSKETTHHSTSKGEPAVTTDSGKQSKSDKDDSKSCSVVEEAASK